MACLDFVAGNPASTAHAAGSAVGGLFGSTAAILGHPVRSLVATARMVADQGERLEAGDIVLAGGATAAITLAPGQAISLEMQGLGFVTFNTKA